MRHTAEQLFCYRKFPQSPEICCRLVRAWLHKASISPLSTTAKQLFLVFGALLVSVNALAIDIPSRPDGYVTDRAGILSAPTKEKLETALYQYEQQTTNQVLVATFPSLDDTSLEDFSIRLAESWKIGQQGKNNGIIF